MKTSAVVALMLLASCNDSGFTGGGSAVNDKKGGPRKPALESDDATTDKPAEDAPKNDDKIITVTDEGDSCSDNLPGFGGKVYKLTSSTKSLPNLEAMTPVGQISAPALDVPTRSWTTGFPGVPDLTSYFAIRFFAMLKVETDGVYQFQTISDDGSKLYIASQLVVNNDGTHSPQTRTSSNVSLKAGYHKIVVEWFQGPPKEIALQVFWKTAGKSFEIIPSASLIHSKLCGMEDVGIFK